MTKIILRVSLLAVVGFILLLFLWPDLRSSATQTITRLTVSAEPVSVPTTPGGAKDEEMDLEIVTLLGFDAIPAILDPEFVSVEEADEWMGPDELVLGLSINGDSRAYSVPMLSSHEIVNDTVGGRKLAVTW